MRLLGRAPRCDDAFTLVELMLAILILAIIMSLVYGVIFSTIEAQERIEEITQASEIGPAILQQIREDLEGAFRPKEQGEFFLGLDKKGSTGDRDRMDFVSGRFSYGAEREGDEPVFHSVNEVGYQVLDNKDEPSVGILYRREDFSVDSEPLKGGRLIEIYDRVVHFNLSYYNGKKWLGGWDSKTDGGKLPQAIRLELKIMDTDRGDRNVPQVFFTTVTYPK